MTTHYEKYTIKDHKGNFCSSDSKGNIRCTSTDPSVNERFTFHIMQNMHSNDRFGLANYRGKYCIPTNTALVKSIFDTSSNKFQEVINQIGQAPIKRVGCDFEIITDGTQPQHYCNSDSLKCTTDTTNFPYELFRYDDGKVSFKKDGKWCTTNENGCLLCDSDEKTPESTFEIWNPVPKSKLHFGNTIDKYLNISLDECVLNCARSESCVGVSFEHRNGCHHPEPCSLPGTTCLLKNDVLVIDNNDPLFTHVDLNRKDLEPYLMETSNSSKWGMGSGNKPKG